MGGSGGRYVADDVDLDRLRQEAMDETERQATITEVARILNELLSEINDRDEAAVAAHLDAIEEALGDSVEDVDQLLFGGSVAKHTYVDGLSDVDSLVILDSARWGDVSPAELRDGFATALERRLPAGEVESIQPGRMAVTVTFRDGTIVQLLPALRRGDVFSVPSVDGEVWRSIKPREFTKALTELNGQHGRAVVPTIKLVKSLLNESLPHDQQLTGYHVEALALAAFSDYSGPRNLPTMLTEWFKSASQNVMRPVPDVTGQSPVVDEYLGSEGSPQRQVIANSLARLAREMQNARTVEHWREILQRD